MHNGSLIPPDRELLMDRFLSQPSQGSEMSCPHVISHPGFFSLGFPLTPFSKLLGSGHPRLASLVASLCHQTCCGPRHCSSEDNLSLQHKRMGHGPMEKPQPSHLEGEVGSGTSPGPQFDLTALLGGVFTPGLHPTASILLGRM